MHQCVRTAPINVFQQLWQMILTYFSFPGSACCSGGHCVFLPLVVISVHCLPLKRELIYYPTVSGDLKATQHQTLYSGTSLFTTIIIIIIIIYC